MISDVLHGSLLSMKICGSQVESTSDLLNAPIRLIDRNADDRRDGYVELLPYRQTFNNVTKKVVSKGDQACLPLRDNEVQTAPSMPVNSWFQYRYQYAPINIDAHDEDKARAFRKFLDKYTDDICDKVFIMPVDLLILWNFFILREKILFSWNLVLEILMFRMFWNVEWYFVKISGW